MDERRLLAPGVRLLDRLATWYLIRRGRLIDVKPRATKADVDRLAAAQHRRVR